MTIHDLSVLLHPEWHPIERVKAYEARFFKALRRSAYFIGVSEFTRQEVIHNLGIAPDRVSSVHNGIPDYYRPLPEGETRPCLDKLGLSPGYLLHVGTIEPRKNLLMLMRAYCGLPRPLRENSPLVLVGGWGWRNESIREYFESTARHAGVIKLGYVPDEQMPALYNGARALVFPSHYEGFGFPPLEMMACGGAVLASSAALFKKFCRIT